MEFSFSPDAIDLQLMDLLQRDATLNNQQLAQRAGVSPATCLRRVARLRESGLIERQVALLSHGALAQLQGHGLAAIVEVSLDRQGAEHLATFEARVVEEDAVQQCWRVSPGPDFVLVVQVLDMPHYQQLAERLFTQNANVRNVKAFFATRRAKFDTKVPLTPVDNAQTAINSGKPNDRQPSAS